MNKFATYLHAPLYGSYRLSWIVNVLLLAAVLGSALAVVRTQYLSRSLFAVLDRAQSTGKQLENQSAGLSAHKRQLIASARVESLAQTQLAMRKADPSITIYLTQP